MHSLSSFTSFVVRLTLPALAFGALTGARGCSGGVGVGGAYAGTAYVEEPPVVVVDHPVIVDVPPSALVGDVALTVTTPEQELPGTTQTFSLVVRQGGAFGPVVLDGRDFGFDLNGVGPVDLTDLPYGLYDLELTGYDAWGAVTAVGAATVVVDEALTYAQVALVVSGVAVVQGDVGLDLVAPDGGVYAPPIDTVDYYLWAVDPVTGASTFVESVGYILYDPASPVVIPALGFGSYYVEVDAFDAAGYRIYTYSGAFDHAGSYTQVVDTLQYAN